MALPQGILRVHYDRQTLTFQVDGQATMHHSLPLRRRAEQALANGVTTLWVDLRRCTYMDSTFLGTLLCLKKTIEQRGEGSFALASVSPQCQRLLRQMGLDKFYTVLTVEELPPEAWQEMAGDPCDAGTFQGNEVQAHEELANLPGPAGDPFREVVRCMAKDAEARRARQAPPPPSRPESGPR
jgi:anti-anti-sigma factor